MVWLEKPSNGILPFTLSATAGLKTIYAQVRNAINTSAVVNSAITYEPLQTVAISFRDTAPYNGINYVDTASGTINSMRPSTGGAYTHKQFKDTTGAFVNWYVELNNSFYPINADSDRNAGELRYRSLDNPTLTSDSPYPANTRDNVFTTPSASTAARKARLAFQLPVGTYQFRFFYSKGVATLSDARRLQAWYRIDINGVQGTPINQWDSGVNTQNNNEWTRTAGVNVTTDAPGNVMFNMWSDFGDIDSGINFIEITKF